MPAPIEARPGAALCMWAASLPPCLFVLAYLLYRAVGAPAVWALLATGSLAGQSNGSFRPDPVVLATELHDARVHVDVSQYGNARHLVSDGRGGLVLAYVDRAEADDDASVTRLVVSWSADDGASWIDLPQPLGPRPNRPALAYDPIGDRVHAALQSGGVEARSDLEYARWRVKRTRTGAIAGLELEGSLVLARESASRPSLIWSRVASRLGRVAVTWTAWDGAERGEVRVTTRALSLDADDFEAEAWNAPDGVRDSPRASEPTGVAFDRVDVETDVASHRFGLACPVIRGGEGPGAGDLYVIYSLSGDADAWRWRKARRGPEPDGGWSRGWQPVHEISRGRFGQGRIEKQLTASCLYDEQRDAIWFSAARHDTRLWTLAGSDVLELYRIDASDQLSHGGLVYWAAPYSSRHLMSSLALVPGSSRDADAPARDIGILYVSGDGDAGDGHVHYRRFRPGVGFSEPLDVYAQSPNNYPSMLERPHGAALVGIFRTNTEPHTLRRVSIELGSGAGAR